VNIRFIWLKVVRPRYMKKGKFFKSFQKTPFDLIKMEKNQENLGHRELNMVILYIRFISAGEELVGKNILSYLRL
jgi:hypothetical protein